GLSVQPLEVESKTAKFDLTLSVAETEQGLKGTFEYNTDLFEGATIQRLAQHFQRLLEGVVAQPEQRIGRLPLLPESQRQQLLVQWNATQTSWSEERCLHELFEAQVARTPEAVALVYEGTQLSYRELNRRANQLAHRLRALGVGPEGRVGVYVPR